MNARNSKLIVIAVLVAGSLAAVSARAAVGVGGRSGYPDGVGLAPSGQEGTDLVPTDVPPVMIDSSSGDGSSNGSKSGLPHYSLGGNAWLGGEWVQSRLGTFGDRPDQYIFGLHIVL